VDQQCLHDEDSHCKVDIPHADGSLHSTPKDIGGVSHVAHKCRNAGLGSIDQHVIAVQIHAHHLPDRHHGQILECQI